MKKTLCLLSLLVGFGLVTNMAFAVDSIYTTWTSNKAIQGHDTVAYFTEGKPVKGKKEFRYDYKGAEWYFSSAENLEAFKAEPEKYAPQYGGYCAYAVSQGTTASTEPKYWAIVDDKLYLNYSAGIQKKWDKDRSGYIADANSKWESVLCKGGSEDPLCQ